MILKLLKLPAYCMMSRGGSCKHYMREGDARKFLPAGSTIYVRSLVPVVGNTLQHTGEQSKHKRESEPGLNEYQRNLCPKWVRQPWYCQAEQRLQYIVINCSELIIE